MVRVCTVWVSPTDLTTSIDFLGVRMRSNASCNALPTSVLILVRISGACVCSEGVRIYQDAEAINAPRKRPGLLSD